MKRKPIYHAEQPDILRIVYKPGHGWVFQTKTLAKGTKEVDPWVSQCAPKRDYGEALHLMYSRFPCKTTEGKRQAVANV